MDVFEMDKFVIPAKRGICYMTLIPRFTGMTIVG